MIHARKDYQEGSVSIGEDEPVFLLRAKDRHFIPMLAHYMTLLNDSEPPASDEMIEAISMQMQRAVIWQSQHKNIVKLPDMPEGSINR